jgi:hypothetical protein
MNILTGNIISDSYFRGTRGNLFIARNSTGSLFSTDQFSKNVVPPGSRGNNC